ncbi:MAG: hypothetical protein JSR85_04325 [Proteobacteria bacterium]|nr:hypothetical protein [Pseudomonadota bacterium]
MKKIQLIAVLIGTLSQTGAYATGSGTLTFDITPPAKILKAELLNIGMSANHFIHIYSTSKPYNLDRHSIVRALKQYTFLELAVESDDLSTVSCKGSIESVSTDYIASISENDGKLTCTVAVKTQ